MEWQVYKRPFKLKESCLAILFLYNEGDTDFDVVSPPELLDYLSAFENAPALYRPSHYLIILPPTNSTGG